MLVRTFSLAPARRALMWRVTAAAAVGLGYAALAGGNITLAPVLLVVAYLVLIPMVVLTW
jgi:hypothetical protein